MDLEVEVVDTVVEGFKIKQKQMLQFSAGERARRVQGSEWLGGGSQRGYK